MATKRCKKCKVPLEGFMYKWIASKLFGIKPSEKDPELCNKCEGEKNNTKMESYKKQIDLLAGAVSALKFINNILRRKKKPKMDWEALTAVGTLLAVMVALFNPPFQDWRQRPILEIQSPQYLERHLRWGQNYGGGSFFYYVDIELLNKGASVAFNCQPLVTAVYEKIGDKWQKESNWTPIGLKWVLDQSLSGPIPRATEEKNLVPKRPYTFSLGYVLESERDDAFKLACYLIPTGQRDKFPPGDYCFEITAYASAAKQVTKYFYINWKGGFSRAIDDFKKKLVANLSNSPPVVIKKN